MKIHFAHPAVETGCGLSASLVVGPQRLGDRQQSGSLGDAVESYLYTVCSAQTPSALALVEDWANLATHLHALLHDVHADDLLPPQLETILVNIGCHA